MIKYILSCLCASFTFFVSGQYQTVSFDYEKSLFNNGQPLPAEKYFEMRGLASTAVNRVELQIYSNNAYPDREALYIKAWKRPFNSTGENFVIPVNYYLRGGDEYDVVLLYFRNASRIEIENFKTELYGNLDAYIDQNLSFERKRIELLQGAGNMIEDMNQIVNSSMTFYRTQINRKFDGFSDLVKDDINLVEESTQNRILGRKSSEEENLERKKQLVLDLKTRIHSEVAYLLNSGLQVLGDLKQIDSYQTEKTQTVFTLHGGYGGTVFRQNQIDGAFGQGGIAGITLPLGKKEFSSPFWSRTSLMLGVYFNNFDLNKGVTATGPLINRPYYAGVGYKFYRFLRISAGATILENSGMENGRAVSSSVYVRPYISLTADINLWIGLAK